MTKRRAEPVSAAGGDEPYECRGHPILPTRDPCEVATVVRTRPCQPAVAISEFHRDVEQPWPTVSQHRTDERHPVRFRRSSHQ